MSNPVARKLAVALAVSIGLNLFLAGMIASAWLTKRHYAERFDRPAAALAGGFDLRRGLEAAGPDARPMAREIRREYGPRLRESGHDMHEARAAVAEVLRADELDPAALAAALRELRQASDKAQAVMHEVLVETMTRLDAEQRRAFLEAATRRNGRGERPRPPREGGG